MVASPGFTSTLDLCNSTFEFELPTEDALSSRGFDSIVFTGGDEDRRSSDRTKVDESVFLLPSCTNRVDSIQGSSFGITLSTFTIGIGDCLWLIEELCGTE
jgi:hypothetical protein